MAPACIGRQASHIKFCRVIVLVRRVELQRKRGKVILRSLAELVFFLLCRE